MNAFNVRATWPLWECISPEALAKLILYQWEEYGLKLELLSLFMEDTIDTEIEPIQEIDKLMRIPIKQKSPKRHRESGA